MRKQLLTTALSLLLLTGATATANAGEVLSASDVTAEATSAAETLSEALAATNIQASSEAEAVSQSSGNTLCLSLEEAKQYALQHNRSLLNASLDVRMAQASRWQSIASMLPQAKVGFDYSNMCGYKMKMQGFEIPLNPNGSLSASVSMAINSSMIIAAQIGKISQAMSDISLEQTRQQVSDQVVTLYFSALVSDQTIELFERNLNNVEKLLEQTIKAVEVGVSQQTDADQLAVQVATMRSSISATKRSAEMVDNAIRLQLGLDADTDIKLTDTIDGLVNVESAVALLDQDFILENNYAYQLLSKSTELKKKQLDIQKWANTPTVSAYYQYSYKTYFGADASMNMTPPNMVGVSVSVPLFTSLKNSKAVQSAKFDYEKQLNTVKDTQEGLLIQHRQLCFDLTSAYETYQIQRENIDVVQRVLDNMGQRFEHGVASSTELTTASNNFISAQSSYVQALLQFVNAQIALSQLLNID